MPTAAHRPCQNLPASSLLVLALLAASCSDDDAGPDVSFADATATSGAAICKVSGTADGAACDDGNPCTIDDTCKSGLCLGKAGGDGTLCDDGEVCTFADRCQAGNCAGKKLGVMFGGDRPDEAHALALLPDGGFALAGFTQSGTDAWGDLWLVRTDSQGKSLWAQAHGGEFFDAANGMVALPDGGFAMAGYTNAKISFSAADLWLIRTDAKGNKLWDRTYGGAKADLANAVVRLGDGGLGIAGYTESKGSDVGDDRGDAWLLRTDADGKLSWDKTFGGGEYDSALALAVAPGGDLVVAGETWSKGAGASDGWFARCDAKGAVVWEKTVGGKADDRIEAAVAAADGGFALAGATRSKGLGEEDMWLMRTDAAGTVLWERTYGGKHGDAANALIELQNGGFALAGYRNSKLNAGAESWLVRTDAQGEVSADKAYGQADLGTFTAASLVARAGGGFALAGRTNSAGTSEYDMLLVLTDATGKSSCE